MKLSEGTSGELYATKDGKTVKLTADNFKDYLELGTKQVIDSVEVTRTAGIWNADGNITLTVENDYIIH